MGWNATVWLRPLAVFLLLACIVAVPANVARAQGTEVLLVGNMGESVASFSTTSDRAQLFTTGSNSDGYTLNEVRVGYADEAGDSFAAAIYSTSGGLPTTSLYSLTH